MVERGVGELLYAFLCNVEPVSDGDLLADQVFERVRGIEYAPRHGLFLGRKFRTNALCARPIFLAQLFFQDLAGPGAGQGVKKFYRARALIVSEAAAAKLQNLIFGG